MVLPITLMAIGGLGILIILYSLYIEFPVRIRPNPKILVILIISLLFPTSTLLYGASLLDTYISSHQSECEHCMWVLQ